MSALTLLFSVYTLSFIFFSIHENGEGFLFGFGMEGFRTLLILFPWTLAILVILLLILLERFVRHFKFGYRVAVLPIFLSIVAISTLASLAVIVTPIHSSLLARAQRNELPLLGQLYEKIWESHHDKGVFRGRITSISTSSFIIAHDDQDSDMDDGVWEIIPCGLRLGSTAGVKLPALGRA